MAQDIVSGLFGPQPWQIQQARQDAIAQAADRFAAQSPFERAAGLGYRAGAGLGQIAGGMLGLEDPAVVEAQQRRAAMEGLDITSPDALLQRAQQVQDPQLRMRLMLMADQKKKEQAATALEAEKMRLAERKQTFQETEAMDLKRTQVLENIRLREKQLEQEAAIARARGESDAAYKTQLLELRRLGLEIAAAKQAAAASQGVKPLTQQQVLKLKADVRTSTDELRSLEDAYSTMEAKGNALLKHPGLPAATGISGAFPSVYGGEAAKAETLLQEFKDELKRQGLQMVREGGSIGQMTVQEWPIVESMVANIDPRKLGLKGTQEQIQNAMARARQILARARKSHNALLADMPEGITQQSPQVEAAAPAAAKEQAPAGLPQGSVLIGKTPSGEPVYQSPDGKKWVQ